MMNSSTRRRCGLLVVMAIALLTAPLAAHDMWIEPTTFFPELGQIVSLRLRVGQDLLGDPLLLDPALVKQFVVMDVGGSRPVVRRDGRDPAGLVRVAAPGALVVGYESNPSAIQMAADKFNQYLKEEGLDAVSATRASRTVTPRVRSRRCMASSSGSSSRCFTGSRMRTRRSCDQPSR